MNKKDKARLERLNRLMTAVPLAVSGTGTKSADIGGFVTFNDDMRKLRPAFTAVLYGMCCDGYDKLYGWEKGSDYLDPDTVMDRIEEFIDARAKDQWKSCSYIQFDYRSGQ